MDIFAVLALNSLLASTTQFVLKIHIVQLELPIVVWQEAITHKPEVGLEQTVPLAPLVISVQTLIKESSVVLLDHIVGKVFHQLQEQLIAQLENIVQYKVNMH